MPSIQYPIQLAPDYDMGLIDERVRTRAAAFGSPPGLRLKAFLTTSIAQGASRNSYAPFYVWESERAQLDFLTGPLFQGVVDSFGRPPVLAWQLLDFTVVDRQTVPAVATFEEAEIAADVPPRELRAAESALHRRALEAPGLCAGCTLLDTRRWAITRVRLWADERGPHDLPPTTQRYRVLKVIGSALALPEPFQS